MIPVYLKIEILKNKYFNRDCLIIIYNSCFIVQKSGYLLRVFNQFLVHLVIIYIY